ncbi:hypothetical protein [Corynebacterium neomassiliense]|uniref:hypothetical protein n=1 Tax=Corynebacterium neomassiliense TaxID=2079482 RepID=UPI0010303087|nr:hypothetical protein [Corynebacterium neomassiliense]
MSNQQPWTPRQDMQARQAGPAGKDPFFIMEITGNLVAALGALGVVVGIFGLGDGDGAAAAIIAGAASFATLGLILVALCKIGSGLWKAGRIK